MRLYPRRYHYDEINLSHAYHDYTAFDYADEDDFDTLIPNKPNSVIEFGDCYYKQHGKNPFFLLVGVKDSISSSFVINPRTRIIGKEAFSKCSNISKVIIPKSVIKIESGAFSFCPKLKVVFIPKQTKYIKKNAFNIKSPAILLCERKKPIFKKPVGWACNWVNEGLASVLWNCNRNSFIDSSNESK